MKKQFIILILIILSYEHAIAGIVQFPDNRIPEKPLIDFRGEMMHVTVVVSNASFKGSPSRKGHVLNYKLNFLETLTAYERTKDKRYYLLKTNTGKWGWIKSDAILTSSLCLKSENKRNPVFLKVFIPSNMTDQSQLESDIVFLKDPGRQNKKSGRLNTFKILYVFKTAKGEDGKDYFFIGDSPTWEYDSSDKSLLGWIDRDKCILWENQVAVYYDKETLEKRKRKAVPIFQKKEDLLNYLNYGFRKNLIAEERKNDIIPPQTRFPVIESKGDLLKIAWIKDLRDKQLCLIGWCSKEDINGVNQLNHYCLIRRSKIDALIGFMAMMNDLIKSNFNKIDKTIKSVCSKSTGYPIHNNEKLSDYLQRVFHFPSNHLSESLRKTLHEINSLFLTNKHYRIDFIKNIKKKYTLLHYVQENKITDVIWNDTTNKWIPQKRPKEKEWFFINSNGYEFCWLPFEYLP